MLQVVEQAKIKVCWKGQASSVLRISTIHNSQRGVQVRRIGVQQTKTSWKGRSAPSWVKMGSESSSSQLRHREWLSRSSWWHTIAQLVCMRLDWTFVTSK